MLNGSLYYAERYCALGMKLVRLHGVTEDGACTCSRGSQCPGKGKHPVDRAWQTTATNDPEVVAGWDEDSTPHNIGLLLGDIIDVEIDGPKAAADHERLGLANIDTPTYRSNRGNHQLFRVPEGWPEELNVAILKPGGELEVRIGRGGKAAQSVLPPSRYKDNVTIYRWLPGLSPDDVTIADLPANLIAHLQDTLNAAYRGEKHEFAETVKEGGRNDDLYRFACSRLGLIRNDGLLQETEAVEACLESVLTRNRECCDPPLAQTEVLGIFASALKFITAEARREAAKVAHAHQDLLREKLEQASGTKKDYAESLGLETAVTADGLATRPGWWSLVCVADEPPYYELRTPLFSVSVKIPADDIRSSVAVAKLITVGTGGRVIVDRNPKQWKSIWCGTHTKNVEIEGLWSILVSEAQLVEPRHEDAAKLDALSVWLEDMERANNPSPDDKADPSGYPQWRLDGSIWVAWRQQWRRLRRDHGAVLKEGDAVKVGKVLAELQDLQERRTALEGGRQYVVVDKDDMDSLRRRVEGAKS